MCRQDDKSIQSILNGECSLATLWKFSRKGSLVIKRFGSEITSSRFSLIRLCWKSAFLTLLNAPSFDELLRTIVIGRVVTYANVHFSCQTNFKTSILQVIYTLPSSRVGAWMTKQTNINFFISIFPAFSIFLSASDNNGCKFIHLMLESAFWLHSLF